MRKTAYLLLTSVLFFGGVQFAFANISYAPNAPTDPQAQFGFYCNPYSSSFASGGYYTPTGGTCTYLLPQQETSAPNIFLAVYKGTPGNATSANFNFGPHQPASILQTSPDDWVSQGSQGDDFFAVAGGWDSFSNLIAEDGALRTGGTAPLPYDILQWKWGIDPNFGGGGQSGSAVITVTPYSVTYDRTPHTATVVATGAQGEDLSADVNLTATTHTSAGDYAADAWTFHDPSGTYPDASGTVQDSIAKLSVFPSGPGVGKIYDGTTAGDVSFCFANGRIFGDDVGCQPAAVNFVTPDVGCQLEVASGITLTGTTAGNYELSTDTFSAGSCISKAPLTVTADNQSMMIGGTLPAFTATVEGFVDGQTLATSGVTGSASCTSTGTPVSPFGTYPISCTQGTLLSNNYAFTNFVNGTLTVTDTSAPVITINTPINGHSYLQNDAVFIDVGVTDDSTTTSAYTLNGNAVDGNLALPLGSQALGPAVFVVTSTDFFGNKGYATSTFTILPPDLTPPTVIITSPVEGATYTDSAQVFLTATISDASPIAATSYTFNGNTVDPDQPLPLIGAPLGPASVSVTASDIYGNPTTATVHFTIKSSDVTPPAIVINNPLAGHTYLSTDSVLADATVTDASGVASTVYTLDGITFDPSQPMPLGAAGAGPATMVVTATDVFGNAASSSVSFTITAPPPPDTQAPVITILSPTAGKKYARNDSVKIVATIVDASAIASTQYFFNGKPVDPTKMLDFSKAPLGTATVKVIATDAFGNTGSATVTFRILPASNSCIEDVTEAFDHKYIANKNVFKQVFEDCNKIHDRENDRNDYENDDHNHHKDLSKDDRYAKAQKDIDDAFNDIDRNINH